MKALICDGAYFLPRLSTQASPLSPGTILYGTRSMSLLTIGSCMRRPISRLIAENVFSGLVTACRFAAWPTSRSPESVNATIEGVVRPPSAFSMTFAFLPSITATHEFVVPRSMPITLLICTSFSEAGPVGPGEAPSRSPGNSRRNRTAARLIYAAAASPTTSAEHGSGLLSHPLRRHLGASPRDRFGQLSYRYSSVLRTLAPASAQSRPLCRGQPLRQRNLQRLAPAGRGRRLRVLDAQHRAAAAAPGCRPTARAVCRPVHGDGVSARARNLGHSPRRRRCPASRAVPPVWS